MVKVKKRDGRIEEYVESKVVTGVKKAGATAKEAEQVAKEVTAKIIKRTEVTAVGMSRMVVNSLKKVNKKAADIFVAYKNNKLKAKKKK